MVSLVFGIPHLKMFQVALLCHLWEWAFCLSLIDRFRPRLTNVNWYWMSTEIDRCWPMSTDVDRYIQMSTEIDRCRPIFKDVDRDWQLSTDMDGSIFAYLFTACEFLVKFSSRRKFSGKLICAKIYTKKVLGQPKYFSTNWTTTWPTYLIDIMQYQQKL